MDVTVYIQGEKIDLFEDENIDYNLNAKNLSDITKVFSDFTQSFNVPASPRNNRIFTHWYDADVDGTFNANVRIDAYIEIKSLPYAFGSIQLNDSKLKNLAPSSYSLTFFGNTVNLSDKFGDEELSVLDLSFGDHDYTDSNVRQGMRQDYIAQGDVYYPLISATNYIRYGSGDGRDIANSSNEITYREFKPAVREIKIIEAIEQRYGVAFTRDFFDRAVFYQKFMWCHKDTGPMKGYGANVLVDISIDGGIPAAGGTVDTANNTITYTPFDGSAVRRTSINVFPEVGFENVEYTVFIYSNGQKVSEKSGTGMIHVRYDGGEPGQDNVCSYYVSASDAFSFNTKINLVNIGVGTGYTPTPTQNAYGYVRIADQLPQMKVADYFKSIVKQFNLIIRPLSGNTFLVDTIDNWYSQGKAYDITRIVDAKEITVKRADVKKQISFLYKKPGAVLNAKYFDTFGIGYGDLNEVFEVSGEEMKVEMPNENMMFERLQDQVTGDLTPFHAGYCIDNKLEPYKGAPFSFYKNGRVNNGESLYIDGVALPEIHHTATENNIEMVQVSNSLNFGADISTYFYSPIEKSTYFNFWKTWVEDLFNRKTRVISVKSLIPSWVLYGLKLNDRFVISGRRYKISNAKINLINNQSTLELFSDLGPPLDSVKTITPLTVDSTEYTVDTEQLTVDMVSVHNPVTSYVQNGINMNYYRASNGQEFFEVYVSANTNWTVTAIDTGDGNGWFGSNKTSGLRSGYIRGFVQESSSPRTGILRFTIGSVDYNLNISQQ